MNTLRVLVVDDSVLYRKILSDALGSFSEIEVVGTAHSGKAALDKIKMTPVDFVTLDFEMPGMDGVEVLQQLKKSHPEVEAVMISAHTQTGAAITMDALSAGAFDFIAKPDSTNMKTSQDLLKMQLKKVISSLLIRKTLRTPRKAGATKTQEKRTDLSDVSNRMKRVAGGPQRVEAIGIAISTGGPNALNEVIPLLPKNLRVPILIVQHMPPVFTKALADSLDKRSDLTVVEAASDMDVKAGTVYIAPGGKQMKVCDLDGVKRICITDDPPENNCKPAADYMLRSMALEYKGAALGIIMTGMGADGVKGLLIMKKFGCRIIAQDQESCVVYGMPMEAMKAEVVDLQLPLKSIADEILNSVK